MSILINVAAALGLKLSERITEFITDEISKEEKENQSQIYQCYNDYLENRKNVDEQVDLLISQKILDSNELTEAEIDKLKEEEKTKILFEIKNSIICLLKNKAEDRKKYYKEVFVPELLASKERILKLTKDHNTEIRKNALEILKYEIIDILNKANAYCDYLDNYCNQIGAIYDNNIILEEEEQDMLFSYTLPEKWSYNGKLFYVNFEELSPKRGYGSFVVHNTIRIYFFIEDFNLLKNNRGNIPIFQKNKTYNKKINKYVSVYSVAMGEYLNLSRLGAYGGIPAVVESYKDRKNIILKYKETVELTLNVVNLSNFSHYPPPGADVIIYPMFEFRKDKKWIFRVSQRAEDIQISLWFDKISMVLPDSKTGEFCNYWQEHNLSDRCMDTKIAPLNLDLRNGVETVKIQFGEEYIIEAGIKYFDEKHCNYLEFHSFIDLDRKIQPEDIFVPFNAEIETFVSSEFDYFTTSNIIDNNNNLIITLFKEFRRQLYIKNNNGGNRYFNTWEILTCKLKEQLEIGESIFCEVDGLPEKTYDEFGCILKYTIKNRDELLLFYKKNNCIFEKQNALSEFFVLFNGIRLPVNIVNMKQHDIEILISKTYDNILDLSELILKDGLEIIKKENAVPEQRQLRALYEFRVGALSNPDLHSFILNGKNIYSEKDKIEEVSLFNNEIYKDDSQYNALISCLEEKNFFMIQGPPGTGKTTVIRELIYQTLIKNSNSKILVVSQANVAVDNVLRGIEGMGISVSDVIRCGRAEKIQPDIVEYSFEKKYNDYLEELNYRSTRDDSVAFLSNRWKQKISSKGHELEIGELLISSHKIIGATCIGLGQKKIGIDKIEFDIVIIDESAKALAPELIVPIVKAKKLIMIGDHKQLPPVINPILYDEEKIEIDDRKYCKNVIFQKSLFERLFNDCPESNKISLATQYRMPSVIGDLINQVFYNNFLCNGYNTFSRKPIFFDDSINVIDMTFEKKYQENDFLGSPRNDYEADYVINLLKDIRKKNKECKIAIITPYKGQKYNIKKRFINDIESRNEINIMIDTIDSFQGDEADIVIFCTTRAKKKTKFFQDEKRLNVALSRTRNELIILCSVAYLHSYGLNTPVRKVIDYIEKHGKIQSAKTLINKKRSYFNNEIIELINFELADYAQYNEMKVLEEKQLFLDRGRFSCIPTVQKKDDKYFFLDHFEIFYAAKSLSLKDIEVSIKSAF